MHFWEFLEGLEEFLPWHDREDDCNGIENRNHRHQYACSRDSQGQLVSLGTSHYPTLIATSILHINDKNLTSKENKKAENPSKRDVNQKKKEERETFESGVSISMCRLGGRSASIHVHVKHLLLFFRDLVYSTVLKLSHLTNLSTHRERQEKRVTKKCQKVVTVGGSMEISFTGERELRCFDTDSFFFSSLSPLSPVLLYLFLLSILFF